MYIPGSKCRIPEYPAPVTHNFNDAPIAASKLNLHPSDSSELSSALTVIVLAFVDLGFGSSAAQQSQRVAKPGSCLHDLAREFHEKAT